MTIPVTLYLRPKGSATWRIEEIIRGIGFPSVFQDTLDGHFELQQRNLISYSEDLSNTTYWENNSAVQTRYFDPTLGAAVQDITVQGNASTHDPNGLWMTLPEQLGVVAQRLAVAPGETYTLSFDASGIQDYQDVTLGIFDADTGVPLTPALTYGPQLGLGDTFVRIVQSFTVPAGTLFVRAELISDHMPFMPVGDDGTTSSYLPTAPAHFVDSTERLQIGNTVFTFPLTTPAER